MTSEIPPNEKSGSEGTDSPTHDHSAHSVPPIPPITTTPEPPQIPDSHANPNHKRRDWLDYFELGIGSVGLIVLTVYTIFSGLQWLQMKAVTKATQQSVTDADLNFRRDERAWISVSFVGGGNIALNVGQPFFVPIQVIDTGKTPAKNVDGNVVVGVFERGKPLEFVYTPGHANYRIHGGRTVFPNNPITENFFGVKHGPEKAEPIIITKTLLEGIQSGSWLIVVHGRITYGDIFGIEHWTTFCRYASNPSQITTDCTDYNDTDNN